MLGAAAWHREPEPSEFSDLFLWFEDGDGSDQRLIPEEIWQELCRICKDAGFNGGIVWITNLQE